VAVSGLEGGRAYTLTEQGLQLGRGEDCELVLPSQNVSRKHARVFLYQGEPYIQDMGSRNGVFVNGMRVQQHGLKAGDTVTMGEFVFHVALGTGAVVKKAGGSRRPMLYGVVALLAVGLVAAAIKVGSSSSQTAPASVVESAAPSEVQNMFKTLEQSPRETSKQAGPSNPEVPAAVVGGQEAPAGVAGDKRNLMVREYLERAQLLQDAGKLTEAREQFERALKLDPGCQLCLTRRERLQKEVAALVQRHLDDGMKAFKALRYDEAIGSWELVLNLSPDPGSQPHQQATRFISDARTKLESQKY